VASLTLLTSGSDTTTNPTVTASVSPTANAPVYAAIGIAIDAGGTNTGTIVVTGAGLTWTQLGTVGFGTRRQIFLWKGVGASPSPGALTITYTPGSADVWTEAFWSVNQSSDLSATPEGTVATATATGTAISVNVVGVPAAGDLVLFAGAHTGAASEATLNGELDTQLSQTGGGTDFRRLVVAFDSAPDSTPVPGVSWTGTEDAGAIALILAALPVGGPVIAWITA
jgi:hypothetical protein